MGRALAIPHVPGLLIVPDIITPERELALVAWIETLPAAPTRVRHRVDLYGTGAFVGIYGVGRKLGAIPAFLFELAAELESRVWDGSTSRCLPDAVTISEYLPGQSLGLHVDHATAGPTIMGLSLLGDCIVRFQRGDDHPDNVFETLYPRRALMLMTGPCRSLPWQHEILPVHERRMSIVFRRASSG